MSLSPETRPHVEKRVRFLLENRDRITIDGDAHPSDPALYPADVKQRMANEPSYYHGRPISGDELLREMDQGGISMALCWQNPAVLRYGEDQQENFRKLLAANAYIRDFGRAHPDRVIPAGWTDPKALGLERAIELARICIEEFGFPIVKMNPAQNAFPIDDPSVMAVVDQIVARGAVPAFHFGSDTEFTPVPGLEQVALRHPDHPVIAVHMGGGGGHFIEAEPVYLAARELGLRRPNIFYVLSAKRDTHIESDMVTYTLAGAPYSRNLAVGSDVPYGRISWNFGGYAAMFATFRDAARHNDARIRANPDLFDKEAVQRILGRNLAELVIAADQRLLAAGNSEAAA